MKKILSVMLALGVLAISYAADGKKVIPLKKAVPFQEPIIIRMTENCGDGTTRTTIGILWSTDPLVLQTINDPAGECPIIPPSEP